MTNKRTEQFDKILETLRDFGRLPTARLSAIVGINYNTLKILLEELLEKEEVKKIEETIATYWEMNLDEI